MQRLEIYVYKMPLYLLRSSHCSVNQLQKECGMFLISDFHRAFNVGSVAAKTLDPVKDPSNCSS